MGDSPLVDTGRVVTLHGRRLTLRPFEADDMEAVLAYRNDPSVSRFQGWPLPFTEADFALLVDPVRRPAETGWISWCVCAASDVIGDVGLRPHGSEAEVGITLAVEAQSHGYASEALARLSAHAFKDLGVQRLHAGVDPANGQVIRLLTRWCILTGVRRLGKPLAGARSSAGLESVGRLLARRRRTRWSGQRESI